jgi:dolichyl-diphosphooligosaccharide--protein glycosyltransferase
LLAKQYVDDDPRGEHLLVVVWFLFMVAATLTQGRFAYYLTVPVAALNAAFVGLVMRVVGSTEDTVEIETYQVLAVVAVLLVVVAPMLVVGAGPVRTASGAQNPGGIVGWQGSLNWMAEETPLEGQYANASGEPMAYYGTYSRTDDFDYPGGAYGVMSWWDYGHWITAVGERIPNANPFQQGSGDAARYLLSQNESASLSVLDSIDEEDAGTRFVMVDWKMVQTESLSPVRGKFFAPPAFADGVDRSTFFSRVLATGNLQQSGLYRSTLAMRHKQAYYDSTVVRLYRYHGSSVQPQPYVLDWQGQERPLGNGETFVRPPQQGSPVKFFDNMSAARAYVQADGSSQVGGIGPYPSERVPAMDHYRLVHMGNVSALQGGETNAFRRDLQQSGVAGEIQSQLGPNATRSDLQRRAVNLLYQNSPAWTKTFERVEGATVEGTGPENASLRLSVQMLPENGAAFNYVKRVETGPDGEFSTTVPYSTTGYDAVGPADGYTNTSVRATGPYTISSGLQANESGALLRWSGTVNVTERQVVGADDSPAVVDVEKQVLSAPPDDNGTAQNGTDGANATVDGADGQPDDGTGDATDDANASSGTGDGASQSLTGAGVAAPDPTVVRP